MTGDEAFLITDLSILTLIGLAIGALFCSFVVGLSAVGGGLLMAVIIEPVLGIKAVVPVISVYLLISNVARVVIYRESINWRKVLPILIPLVPAVALGTKVYLALEPGIIALILGTILIISVPIRRITAEKKLEIGNKGMLCVGAGFGFYSGTALGGGIILIPVFLGAGVFGPALIATDAVVSIVVNVTRTAMFGWHDALGLQLLLVGAILGIVSFPCIWASRWIMGRTSIRVHTIAMEILMIVAGFYFLWKAYSG
ncbi:MAG: sulfite exporter TauE/SafE family protein [Rhodospirillales bacterium]|jgi:uncharacterized membrane protein YfcA